MMQMTLVFLGGGIGSVLRYLSVHGMFAIAGMGAAWAIMLVNITGSFVMGLALAAAARDAFGLGSVHLQLLFMTGVLGGFTTFSAFSADVLKMMQNGHYTTAAVYIAGSVVLSLLAACAGYYLMNGKSI